MLDMMNNLDDEPHCSDIRGGDRRQTADPADMASIMRGLEDDENVANSKQSAKRTPRSSERRATCDPSDMLDMMNNLDDESHCSDIRGGDRRQTADPADMASIMRGLEDDEKVANSKQSAKRTPRSSERRATCDPSDMLDMMNNLDDESHCSDIRGGDRRQTADPADMASIMRGLEDDEKALKKKQQDSTYDSDDNEVSGMISGRESLDTVALVQSVGKMLQDLEDQEGEESSPQVPSFSISTMEAMKSKKAAIEVEEESFAKIDLSLSLSSASDCDETTSTMGLIDNIRCAIDAEGGDDDTFMTASSFGSMAGLLNISIEPEKKTTAVKKACVAVSMQSPRRSNRLSSVEEEVSKCKSIPRLTKAAALTTPLKDPLTDSNLMSKQGLRSCLASRTKPTLAHHQASPCLSLSVGLPIKKNVVFGSPKVAEFNRLSPATNMTPMRKEVASRMFSMNQKNIEEEAREKETDAEKEKEKENKVNEMDNSDEWDRLTNTSGGTGGQSDDEMSPLPVPGSPAISKRYYAVADPDSPASIVAEYTHMRRSPRRKSNSPHRLSILAESASASRPASRAVSASVSATPMDCNVSMTSEVTGTVNLPGTLSELLATADLSDVKQAAPRQAAVMQRSARYETRSLDVSLASCDDQTEELEIDLHSLIHRNTQKNTSASDLDVSRDVSRSGSAVLPGGRDVSQFSESSLPSLGPLLGLFDAPYTDLSVQACQSEAAEEEGRERFLGKESSLSSPMSRLGPNDSFISLADPTASLSPSECAAACSNNIIQSNSSMISNTTSNSVDDNGVTVELEGRLEDLMNEVGSPAVVGRKSKAKKSKKKRAPLRGATPSVTYTVPDVSSPWAGDMSMISTVDDDHTERLAGNLCDFVSSVAPSSGRGMRDNAQDNFKQWADDNDGGDDCDGDTFGGPGARDCTIDLSVASPKNESSNLNLMAGRGGGGGGLADMSVCSVMDRSMDMSTTRAGKLSTLEGMAMMRRLSVLNAEARINALDQCGTPLAAKGSMSIGMKRHSLSVTQHLAQSNSKKHRASVSDPFRAARAALFATSLHAPAPSESSSPPIASAVPVVTAIASTLEQGSKTPMQSMSQGEAIISKVLPTLPFSSPIPTVTRSPMEVVEQEPIAQDVESSYVEATVDDVVLQEVHHEEETSSSEEVAFFEERMSLESAVEAQSEGRGDADTEASPTCNSIAQSNMVDEEEVNNVCVVRSKVEANTHILASTSKKTNANLAGKIQLRDLRLQIEEARRQLDSCEQNLHALQSEVSAILESKKDQAVSLLEQRVEEDRACALRKDREAAEMEIMKNAAASELLSVEKAYLTSKQGVGLLNRLTYCRVLSYLSSVIELEAVLSPKLRVQLLFHLSNHGGAGKLIVDGTHVDLKYTDAGPVSTASRADTYWDRETILANIFFSDVMCSETVEGPLSEGLLSLVLCPADIPAVMRRVRHCRTYCLHFFILSY
jgi:hypothetical protein